MLFYIGPEENVATLRHSAQVIRGEMKSSLLDGDHLNYDLDRGFTRHPIDDNHGQGVVIKLNMPYIINTIKMLLWDRDMRLVCHDLQVIINRMMIGMHSTNLLSLLYVVTVHCVKCHYINCGAMYTDSIVLFGQLTIK